VTVFFILFYRQTTENHISFAKNLDFTSHIQFLFIHNIQEEAQLK
jgi:hypothetical protein